mgnify:CR=1 FL=1
MAHRTQRSVVILLCLGLSGCAGTWAFTNVSVTGGHGDLSNLDGLENTSLFVTCTWSRVPLPVTVVDEQMKQIMRQKQEEAWREK